VDEQTMTLTALSYVVDAITLSVMIWALRTTRE
jgi:hypothetical protein